MRKDWFTHLGLASTALALFAFTNWANSGIEKENAVSNSQLTANAQESVYSPQAWQRLKANPVATPVAQIAQAPVTTKELIAIFGSVRQIPSGPFPSAPTVTPALPTPTPISPARLNLLDRADRSGNGLINAEDAVILHNLWTTPNLQEMGDLNNDGIFNAVDILLFQTVWQRNLPRIPNP